MEPFDPFLIQPEIWFAVLCEEVQVDDQQRFDLRRVFNRWFIGHPPASTGLAPFAHVKAILAVGLSAGVGSFSGTVEIQDVDGRVLFKPDVSWPIRMGPGETMGTTLFAQIEWWFQEIGNYFYVVRLEPGGQDVRVRLEIAERPPSPGPHIEPL